MSHPPTSIPPDAQTRREAERFRPNRAPLLLAVAANVLLAALALGVPYWRGHAQARDALGAFSGLAACLYGGRAQTSLGLGLPPRTEAWFASQYMTAGPDWPARCRPLVDRGTPPEVIFVWPAAKQAGAEVRAAAALLGRELDTVIEARRTGVERRVPSRVLAAVSKLRSALTLFARAADVDATLDDDAIAFEGEPTLVEPVRLPLYAGASAALEVRAGADTFEATGLDGAGLSWVRVQNRQIDRRRVARSTLVRGVVRTGDRVHVVWAMPPDKCAEREDRCVKRAMGIAAFDPAVRDLPEPLWLGAHPLGRIDRSARVHAAGETHELDLLALDSPEGDGELRHFTLEPPREPKAPPRAAFSTTSFPERPLDALLLDDAVVYATRRAEGLAVVRWPYRVEGTSVGEPATLGTLAGERAWLAECTAAETRWIVAGTDAAWWAARLAPGAEPLVLPPVTAPLGGPLHADDPARDRVRLACDAETLALVALDPTSVLSLARCTASGCTPPNTVADHVAAFDVASIADTLVVATTGHEQPEVLVHRFDRWGAPRGKPEAPAACWNPLGGVCGAPTLAVGGGRLLLVARDGSDLLVLASADAGAHWTAPPDLGGGAERIDTRAVMQQHRLRKGDD